MELCNFCGYGVETENYMVLYHYERGVQVMAVT